MDDESVIEVVMVACGVAAIYFAVRRPDFLLGSIGAALVVMSLLSRQNRGKPIWLIDRI